MRLTGSVVELIAEVVERVVGVVGKRRTGLSAGDLVRVSVRLTVDHSQGESALAVSHQSNTSGHAQHLQSTCDGMQEGDRLDRHPRQVWGAGGGTDCDKNVAGCRDQDDFDGRWGSLANTSGGVGGLLGANRDGRRRHGAKTVARRDGGFCSRTGMRVHQQRYVCRADRGDTGLYWLEVSSGH